MYRAFEIRLYPTELQEQKLNQTFGACRFIYNCTLYLKQKCYKEKIQMNIHQYLVNENPWIKDVEAKAIQCAEQDLEKAYKNWFNSLSHKTKQKTKAPKFKKKHDKQSYRTLQMRHDIYKLCNQETRKIMIPKIGLVSYRTGYDFSKYNITKVCNITVKKSKTNKYYCSICCECEEPEKLYKNNYSIGFDLGLKDFLIDSDGIVIDNPKYFRKSQDKLAKEQRKLSHCVKGSNNYNKQKLKVALVYEKVKNQRKDFQHKVSHQLINENQVIYMETLKVKDMMKNNKLAKSIADVSWYEFSRQLQYKAEWYGRELIKIDTWFPSSQICSNCGFQDGKKPLSIRQWICPQCGAQHDRDINAAKNILIEGMKTAENAGLAHENLSQ